jgi:hypothetical protein
VLREHVDYYNRCRPHQGIEQHCPIPMERACKVGPVKCRDVLGGIIHDYHREAALPKRSVDSLPAHYRSAPWRIILENWLSTRVWNTLSSTRSTSAPRLNTGASSSPLSR